MVLWVSGLANGPQNRLHRFDSGKGLFLIVLRVYVLNVNLSEKIDDREVV